MLSDRAKPLTSIVKRNDMEAFFMAMKDAYDSKTNPDGYLCYNVAENQYQRKFLNDKIKEKFGTEEVPTWFNNYGPSAGHPDFVQNIASMMEESWLRGVQVDACCLLTQASVNSVIDSLAYCVSGVNDCWIIPTPMYMAFKFDLEARCGVYIENAPCAHPEYIPTREVLESAYNSAVGKGRTPRAILITNPHNPTGLIYSEEQLNVMIDFALEKKIFLFSDEVYGNSVFEGEQFSSIAHVMAKRNPDNPRYMGDYVSIISGLSKTWCMAGFKIGAFFTHNQTLYNAMTKLCVFQGVAFPMQHMINCVFEDEEFMETHGSANRKTLKEGFEILKNGVEAVGLSITPAKGSFTAWIDFRTLMPEPTFEWETKIWNSLLEDAKILLATGQICLASEPGFFRITYMFPEETILALSDGFVPRLKKWVAVWKQKHLHDKNTNNKLPVFCMSCMSTECHAPHEQKPLGQTKENALQRSDLSSESLTTIDTPKKW